MEASIPIKTTQRATASLRVARLRRARRAAYRIGALVLLVAVATLVLGGERWLFENNPASMATVMAHAGKRAGAQ